MSLQPSAAVAANDNKVGELWKDKNDKSRFKWEKLPLEVYETLVQYLDGISLVNLCLSSPDIKERLLEPFALQSFQKRQNHWHKFCRKYLDNTYVLKIFSSFDVQNVESFEVDTNIVCTVSWEDVFKAYISYWTTMLYANACNQRLKVLENKLKAEILCMEEATNPLIRSLDKTNYSWITCSGGGKVILNIMQPCPSEVFNHINMVTVEVTESVFCRHLSSVCKNSASFLGMKLVYFPLIREQNDSRFLHVDRVVLTACNQCITTTPLLGGVTKRMPWMEEESQDSLNTIEKCPVFEVYKNVIAIWPLPKSLVFLLMIASPGQEGYEFCLMYRVRCDKMDDIWNTLLKHPRHYLPMVIEYKGDPNATLINEYAKPMLLGGSQYLCHPDELMYYGLALISPFHETKLLKPLEFAEGTNNEVQSVAQLYSLKNSKRYLHHFKEPVCSGKGHGIYVFCSKETIAVSWNGFSWIFGHLNFPSIVDACRGDIGITHVEVMTHNNGLLLVVNEHIVLVEVQIQENQSGKLVEREKIDLSSDLELKIRPLRLFQTPLASLGKKIAHIELDFENGHPFFLVISKNQAEKLEAASRKSKVENELSVCIMRTYFES